MLADTWSWELRPSPIRSSTSCRAIAVRPAGKPAQCIGLGQGRAVDASDSAAWASLSRKSGRLTIPPVGPLARAASQRRTRRSERARRTEQTATVRSRASCGLIGTVGDWACSRSPAAWG